MFTSKLRVMRPVRSVLRTSVVGDEWREAFKVAWSIYVPVRILLVCVGALFVWLDPLTLRPPVNGLGGWLERLLLDPWNAFDVAWYTNIAKDGYGVADGRAAFHPLLPLLMYIVGSAFGGQYILGGLVVSNLACLVLLATYYQLVRQDHGPAIAREAATWLLWAPTGFILLIPYTEPLMLCFALLSFWFARQERWLAAGLWGCLAVLTKQPAIALVPALLWQYAARSKRQLVGWQTVRVLLCISLIPVGYLSYSMYRSLLLSEIATTSVSAFVDSLVVSRQLQQQWGGAYGWPWEMVARVIVYMPLGGFVFWIRLALVLLGLGLLVRALCYTKAPIAIYSIAQVGLSLIILLDFDPLMSLPRRIMLAFPLFVELARWTLYARFRRVWFALGGVIMVMLAGLFTTQLMVP